MAAVTKTIFRDLRDRAEEARPNLKKELDVLEKRPLPNKKEQAAIDRIKALLAVDPDVLLDPLFVAARDAFNDPTAPRMLSSKLKDHKSGVLVAGSQLQDDEITRVSLVIGTLARDKATPPRLVVADAATNKPLSPVPLIAANLKTGSPLKGKIAVADTTDPAYRTFTEAFYNALGRVSGVFALAQRVLPILQIEGDPDGVRGNPGEVSTEEFAGVIYGLRDRAVTESEPQLRRRVNQSLDDLQRVGFETDVPEMAIDIPNFAAATNYQIVASNIDAMGPMICAAMFDELKAFEVVDHIVESAQNGTLTTGMSDAGAMIYEYWKSAPNRMSEGERRNFYALTMGIPGGSVNGGGNREFNDLWIRFVSSVSSLVRQKTADQILRSNLPAAISQQQVRKAARDLAYNLSRYTYGMLGYAARDLQDQIMKIIRLLSHPDILRAYGSLDMWQVIDQVATLELGGARNSARYSTMATCGAIITRWLSLNVTKYNSPTSTERVIDIDAVISQFPSSSGVEATKNPTDYDLVNACELWLADTAVSDMRVEEYSQPREAPVMTSRPVQIPSVARDLLEQALPPGLGFGMRR